MREHPRAQTPAPIAVGDAGDMTIERGQYAEGAAPIVVQASGSATLDQLTRNARTARATDIYLTAGVAPMHRVGGELVQGGANAMDADTIARELGIVATADARAAWAETGIGTFAYGDGAGRVRVTLGRDAKGPTAALRLLPEEAPAVERLNLGKAGEWLGGGRGMVLVVGGAGAGKTVALASLVRALADKGKRVTTIEHPIEMVHATPFVSQRAVGDHVPTARAGVAAALAEGADAIALGHVGSADAAAALVEAASSGTLVLAAVTALNAATAVERVIGYLDAGFKDLGRAALGEAMVGAVRVTVGKGGARSYETSNRPG
jgi:twitching motility protein PilT